MRDILHRTADDIRLGGGTDGSSEAIIYSRPSKEMSASSQTARSESLLAVTVASQNRSAGKKNDEGGCEGVSMKIRLENILL